VRRFSAFWKNKHISARKNSQRSALPFDSSMRALGFRRTREVTATAPFTGEDVRSILNAGDIYYRDKANAARLRALVFLLSYSRLGMSDAVTLSRHGIQDDKFFLYMAKQALRFIARSLHSL